MVTATGAKAEGEGRRAGGGGGGGGLRATGRAGAMRAPLEPWPLSALKENSRFPGRVAAPEGTLRIVSPVCTGMVVLSTTILQPPIDASAMRRAAASKLLGIARERIRMQVGRAGRLQDLLQPKHLFSPILPGQVGSLASADTAGLEGSVDADKDGLAGSDRLLK